MVEAMSGKVRISMVDIDALVELLIDVWENGVDYVDIEFEKKEGADLISLIARSEMKEEESPKKKLKKKKKVINKLSEDNLDDLIM
jgi:hypothetical protein